MVWQIEVAKQNQHSEVACPRPCHKPGKKKKREKTCSLVKNQLANQHCMVSSGLRSTCFVTFTFHSTLLFPHFRDAGALWAQPPALAHLLPLCLLFTRGCRAKASSAWFPAISSLPPFSLPFLYSLDPTLFLSLLSIYYKILCPLSLFFWLGCTGYEILVP